MYISYSQNTLHRMSGQPERTYSYMVMTDPLEIDPLASSDPLTVPLCAGLVNLI